MKADVSHLKEINKNSELNRMFDDLAWEIEQRAKDIASSIMVKGQLGRNYDLGDCHELHSALEDAGIVNKNSQIRERQ